MRRTASVVVAVLAMLTVGSSCRHKIKVSHLDKKEWIVLPIGVNADGVCALQEKQPGDLRTEAKSQVVWIVVGSCPLKDGKPQTIEIKRAFLKNGQGQGYDPFNDTGSKLKEDIPSAEGSGIRLKGKLKDAVEKGRYKYTILINGQDAQWRSRADDGDFYLCPVWPCGDFND